MKLKWLGCLLWSWWGKMGNVWGNVWGKEKFLQESLQMWGKCGENREIENR